LDYRSRGDLKGQFCNDDISFWGSKTWLQFATFLY